MPLTSQQRLVTATALGMPSAMKQLSLELQKLNVPVRIVSIAVTSTVMTSLSGIFTFTLVAVVEFLDTRPASPLGPQLNARRGHSASKAVVDYSTLRVMDLTRLPARRIRLRNVSSWVPDAEQQQYIGRELLLIREPQDPYDAAAIAVYSKQRKIGHVPAKLSLALSILLAELPAVDGFIVGSAAELRDSLRFYTDLPTPKSLRKLVNEQHPSVET